jgi:hypothetical protein
VIGVTAVTKVRQWPIEEARMAMQGTGRSRHALWRLATTAPLPLLVVLYALWTDLVMLDGTGFHLAWSPADFTEWLALTLGTVCLVVAFWVPVRAVRIFAGALHSFALAFGFGAAGVIGIVHAFGGPGGDMEAPGWALAALGLTSLLCALALLALAALLVEDIRAADAEQEGRG